jgi:hypothetical protein
MVFDLNVANPLTLLTVFNKLNSLQRHSTAKNYRILHGVVLRLAQRSTIFYATVPSRSGRSLMMEAVHLRKLSSSYSPP